MVTQYRTTAAIVPGPAQCDRNSLLAVLCPPLQCAGRRRTRGSPAEEATTALLGPATVTPPGTRPAASMETCVSGSRPPGGGASQLIHTTTSIVSIDSMIALEAAWRAVQHSNSCHCHSVLKAQLNCAMNMSAEILHGCCTAVCWSFAATWMPCSKEGKVCCSSPGDTCVYKTDKWSRCEPDNGVTRGLETVTVTGSAFHVAFLWKTDLACAASSLSGCVACAASLALDG